ncbi:MAG: regulator [Candidatus Thermoplasmatota archaeon]|nr:regulator [Candidatus Thermoplasmatota archaeon]
MTLREKIDDYFEGFYVQKKIAYTLLKYGLKIKGNKLFCGPIEQSNSKLARAISVDYRAVTDTIKKIRKNKELEDFFSLIEPTPKLKHSAQKVGWGVIEIIPEDPPCSGVFSNVSKIFADKNISIKQAIAEDYDITEDPRIIIVTEKPIPNELLPKIKEVKGIIGITIY